MLKLTAVTLRNCQINGDQVSVSTDTRNATLSTWVGGGFVIGPGQLKSTQPTITNIQLRTFKYWAYIGPHGPGIKPEELDRTGSVCHVTGDFGFG